MVDKPAYHIQPYESPARLSELLVQAEGLTAANGQAAPGAGPQRPLIHNISEPTEDVASLGDYVARACAEAAAKVAADSVSDLARKAANFQQQVISYVSKIDQLAKVQQEIATKDADLTKREAEIRTLHASRTIGVRVLMLIALVTSCAIWIFTAIYPESLRIGAASVFSLVTVGPLVALLWKRG